MKQHLTMGPHALKLNWDAEPATASVDYTLNDTAGRDASAVKAYLLNDRFAERASVNSGTANATLYTEVHLHTFTEADYDSAEWRAVFTAIDAHADQHREHVNRRMLAVNAVTDTVDAQITAVAVGFRVWRSMNGNEPADPIYPRDASVQWEMRHPYGSFADDVPVESLGAYRVLFRVFVRINWNGEEQWYTDYPVTDDQIGHFAWIGTWSRSGSEVSTPMSVQDIDDSPVLRNGLRARMTWRRLINRTSTRLAHGDGSARWYGFDHTEPTNPPAGWSHWWTVEHGTHWWGAKVSWNEPGPRRLIFLLPSDRRNGIQLIRNHDSQSEEQWEGGQWVRAYENPNPNDPDPSRRICRYNWRTVGEGAATVRQREFRATQWAGRISGRARYDINPAEDNTSDDIFDNNDPFFDNFDVETRPVARARQGALNLRIMEWGYSFIGTPYGWGGQTYGGFQSTQPGHPLDACQSRRSDQFTCSYTSGGSHRIDHIIGPVGSSRNYPGIAGFGIDCSGFVSEAAALAGRAGLDRYDNGNGPSAGMMVDQVVTQGLAGAVTMRYIRPGDYLVTSGHVVYFRSAPVFGGPDNDYLLSANTLEADPRWNGSRGRVQATNRSDAWIQSAHPRRWIAP